MFAVANAQGQHVARLVHAWHQACSHSVEKPEKNVPRCLSLDNCRGNDLRFAYFSTENQLHQHLGISLASDHFSHLSDLQSKKNKEVIQFLENKWIHIALRRS